MNFFGYKNDKTKLNFYNETKTENLVTISTTGVGNLENLASERREACGNSKLVFNVGGIYVAPSTIPAEISFNFNKASGAHKVPFVTVKTDVFDDKQKVEKDNSVDIEVPAVADLAKAMTFDITTGFSVDNFTTSTDASKRTRRAPYSEVSALGGDRNAAWCAKCANTVYDDVQDVIPGLVSVAGNMTLGVANDGTDPNHTRWHIWKDPSQPGVYFLAFRGTHMTPGQYIDVISDVSGIPIMVPLNLNSEDKTKVGVHGGFYTGINNNSEAIYATLADKCPDLTKLYVTGHSLGAALSQVFLFFHLRQHAVTPFSYSAQTISFAAPQSIHARGDAVNKLITLFQGKSVNFMFNRDVVPLAPRMLANKKFLTELLKDAMDVAKAKIGVSNFFLTIVNTFTGSKAAAADMIDAFSGAIVHTMGFSENYDVYHDTVHLLRDKDKTVAMLQSAAQRNAWYRSTTINWEIMDLTTCIMDHNCDNYVDAVGRIVQV